MRRILVIGCGGSGGSTLAYMMDQLRSDLAEAGVGALPAGWQFVHIDVPTAPDEVPDGLRNVRDQGGSYYGGGPQNGNYNEMDRTVTHRLIQAKGLEHVATWAPREPQGVDTPISEGAGQYRAIGRMITLSTVVEIDRVLTAALDRLDARDDDQRDGRAAGPRAGRVRVQCQAAGTRGLLDGGRCRRVDGARRLPHPHHGRPGEREPRGRVHAGLQRVREERGGEPAWRQPELARDARGDHRHSDRRRPAPRHRRPGGARPRRRAARRSRSRGSSRSAGSPEPSAPSSATVSAAGGVPRSWSGARRPGDEQHRDRAVHRLRPRQPRVADRRHPPAGLGQRAERDGLGVVRLREPEHGSRPLPRVRRAADRADGRRPTAGRAPAGPAWSCRPSSRCGRCSTVSGPRCASSASSCPR